MNIDERYYIKDGRIRDVCEMYKFEKCSNSECLDDLCIILNLYHQMLGESECLVSALKDEVRELREFQIPMGWVREIQEYADMDEQFIIKLALSFTLQSLRNGEDLQKFRWGDEC